MEYGETTAQETAEVTSPEAGYPEETSAPLPEETEPEVGVTEDGEVNFRDDFFGDVKDEPEAEAPKYYTAEELTDTPYEEWDIERLPEDVRRYADIVRSQMVARQAQAQRPQRPTTPPGYEAPHEYTPKELAEDAQKLAVQKLGLTDADEFDDYEPEHRAALNMAMQELVQKDYAARQTYARVTREYQDLQRFNDEMTRRPDWLEFDRWFAGRMKAENLTPEQVNAALSAAVNSNGGGNWSAVQKAMTQWYREFQAGKQSGRGRAQRPPALESTSSGYEGRGSINLRDFGDMDMDRQAQALMKLGIV